MGPLWWWRRHDRDGAESVDVVARRLSTMASELEEATGELRAIVDGLRVGSDAAAGGSDRNGRVL